MAYARAVKRFFDWCEDYHLGRDDIEPIAIAAYIDDLGSTIAKPSVKQHLAAMRQLFDYLVTGGILLSNPTSSVRGPKYVVTQGKTPVLSGDEIAPAAELDRYRRTHRPALLLFLNSDSQTHSLV